MEHKKHNITKLIVIMPILFITLTIVSSIYIAITVIKQHEEQSIINYAQSELHIQKQYIKTQIDLVSDFIEQKKSESKTRLKQRLEERVNMGYNLLTQVYEQNKNRLSQEELQKEILKSLRKVRFGENGYLFVGHIKNDKEIILKLSPSSPHVEGRNTYALKDNNGVRFVQEFAQTALNTSSNEGFVEYSWYKLGSKVQKPKISFVKLFEPFDWYIGYGEYYEDFDIQIQEEVKGYLDQFRYAQEGYVWTHDTAFTLIQHPFRQKSIGQDDTLLEDKKGTKIIQMFVKEALSNKEGAYVNYYWPKPNETVMSKKIGFVKHIADWNWVIGTGVYEEDVQTLVERFKAQEDESIKNIITDLLLISFVMLVASVSISLFVSRKVNQRFYKYEKEIVTQQEQLQEANAFLEYKVEEKTKELTYLNEELEFKIEARLAELKQKDAKLIEQAKMVALGDMIANIAHQWRQPLSVISTAASGLQLKNELGILKEDEIEEFSKGIITNTKQLSEVIEDFGKYVQGESVYEHFDVNQALYKVLSIFDTTIHEEHLNIIKNFEDDLIVKNYMNELIQTIINILNNAKDAFAQRQIEDRERIIFMETYHVDKRVGISITDTAGGIDEAVMPKIFEPYFTTKHQSQGTGLGLYMSYISVVENMQGELKVANVENTYKDRVYKGAHFQILLPVAQNLQGE